MLWPHGESASNSKDCHYSEPYNLYGGCVEGVYGVREHTPISAHPVSPCMIIRDHTSTIPRLYILVILRSSYYINNNNFHWIQQITIRLKQWRYNDFMSQTYQWCIMNVIISCCDHWMTTSEQWPGNVAARWLWVSSTHRWSRSNIRDPKSFLTFELDSSAYMWMLPGEVQVIWIHVAARVQVLSPFTLSPPVPIKLQRAEGPTRSTTRSSSSARPCESGISNPAVLRGLCFAPY